MREEERLSQVSDAIDLICYPVISCCFAWLTMIPGTERNRCASSKPMERISKTDYCSSPAAVFLAYERARLQGQTVARPQVPFTRH